MSAALLTRFLSRTIFESESAVALEPFALPQAESLQAWSGEAEGWVARLEPLRPRAELQEQDAAKFQALGLPAGQAFVLELGRSGGTQPAVFAPAELTVRDSAGAACGSVAPETLPAPWAGLFALPVRPLGQRQQATIWLWGRAPGGEARLELVRPDGSQALVPLVLEVVPPRELAVAGGRRP